ncbi:MAG: hypothetical protein HY791_36490 [Deltaproteobacteria bacterium]|nr:hypothetical protein [Deltaproteobacteria bacterium]
MTRLVLMGALLGVATSAWAGTPEIDEATRHVDVAAAALTSVERDRAAAERDVEAFARRIKSLRAKPDASARRELEQQLAASVAAETRVQSLARLERDRRAETSARITLAIKLIDAQLVKDRPLLKSSDRTERVRIAQAMKGLIDLRAGLRKKLSSNASSATTSAPEVEIDPLDGPEELREKADVAEDQRDRIAKKRGALFALIAEVRQEREVARAAGNFQRDVELFGEPFPEQRARTGAVKAEAASRTNDRAQTTDKSSPGAAREVVVAQPPPADGRATAGPDPQAPLAGTPLAGNFGTETDDATQGAPPPPAPVRVAQEGGAARAPAAPPSFSGVEAPSAGAARLDSASLLRLRVEDLDGSRTDLAALERLEQDLAKLEAQLSAKARKIRDRAVRLEADENR